MLPKKLLLGGTAAVGSVATAAVVTTGLPFSSKVVEPQKEAESKTRAKREAAEEELRKEREKQIEEVRQATQENQVELTNWLEKNKETTSNWEIKILDTDGQIKEFTEINPKDFADYLNDNLELLKSLSEETKTTFTFKKIGYSGWEHLITKEQILTWAKNTSEGKAALKLADEHGAKALEGVSNLKKLLGDLTGRKSVFEAIKQAKPETAKNVLFEWDGSVWKHSKSEIKDWKESNKFEISIKKNGKDATALDSTDENDLIGLFDYLDSQAEDESELFKYKSQTAGEKVTLTLKKDQSSWSVVQDKTTKRNWIINTVGRKENLKLYEDGVEKDISQIEDETELGQLEAVVKSLEEVEKGQGVIVFEKHYEEGGGDNKSWMRIKDAIEDFIDGWEVSTLDVIKIQISGSTKKTANEAKDEELIGLLKHMQDHESKEPNVQRYEKISANCLIFEKVEENKWQWIDKEECRKKGS